MGLELSVPHVADFAFTGTGEAAAWQNLPWAALTRVGNGTVTYATRTKLAWSDTGLYFLVDCEDCRLTCTALPDNADLYREDVVEMFAWPSAEQPLYFEYEISPLGAELPILVPNRRGRFHGWLPWHYDGGRRIRHAATVRGGAAAPGASVSGWTVEFCLPFALLVGLGNVPPAVGTTWRGNVYRIDYDGPEPTQWAWCPDTGGHFHDFAHFGTWRFA